MTPEEKQISFYNNYFIYKKIRNVDTNAVFNTMTGISKYQEEFNKLEEKEASKSANNEQLTNNSKKSKPKNISRKIKKKLRLKDDEQNIIC